jgi:hypothetical protein
VKKEKKKPFEDEEKEYEAEDEGKKSGEEALQKEIRRGLKSESPPPSKEALRPSSRSPNQKSLQRQEPSCKRNGAARVPG